MKRIKLTQGFEATIDDVDFERVSKHSWHAEISADGNRVYARSTFYLGNYKKKNVRLHRFILDPKPNEVVDHKNGNKSTLDCRRSNLRIVDKAKNALNQKLNKRNLSGFRGVSFHKQTGKWRASIALGGKRKSLGLYNSPKEASMVADKERKSQWG